MRITLVVTLFLCTCAFVMADGAQAEETVAKISAGQYGVEWHPTVDYQSIALSVGGPDGADYWQEFASNEFPYFDFYGRKDKLLPDGVYTYELTVSPALAPQTKKSLSLLGEVKDRERIASRFRKRGLLPEGGLKQSGNFSFKGGKVLLPNVAAPKVPDATGVEDSGDNKDIIHADDTIVNGGSLCAGLDCVNGESFGFDTLRLKENNLRIHFQDTSVSASFPTNDWRIVANDSSNGGGNYLAFEDSSSGYQPFRVDAAAGANALRVEAGGNVGIGTANPVLELHVTSGDTPTLRLEQDGSSGFTQQTWDLAGNEAGFFLRDVNNGSKLVFRVRPDAPTSSIDVRADGKTGLGTENPLEAVHVRRVNKNAVMRLESTGNGFHSGIEFARQRVSDVQGGGAIWLTGNTTTNQTALTIMAQSTQEVGDGIVDPNAKRLTLDTTSGFLFESGNVGIDNTAPGHLLVVGTLGNTYCDGTDWHTTSSRESKKNIEELSDADLTDLFNVLEGLDLVKFQYKTEAEDATPRVGMIAEEMPDVLASEDGKSLSLGRHVGFLMGVVKAMHEQNKQLAEEVSELKTQVETLTNARPPNSDM